jgi:hypothetical protein
MTLKIRRCPQKRDIVLNLIAVPILIFAAIYSSMLWTTIVCAMIAGVGLASAVFDARDRAWARYERTYCACEDVLDGLGDELYSEAPSG